MKKFIGAGVLAVLCAALAAGCTQSDTQVVQRSAMPGETSTSVENALKRIPSCKKILWRESFTANGVIVTASCPIAELYGVREAVKSRLRELEQGAASAYEGRKKARAAELGGAIEQERRIKAEIDSRTVTERTEKENVRAGGVANCSYFLRVGEMLEKSLQTDERLIASECKKGQVECGAAREVYEPQIKQLRSRLSRIGTEAAECRAQKEKERERVKSLNARYEAAAREEKEKNAQESQAAAERLSALEAELARTLAAPSDEALDRDMAAIGRLRPCADLEKLAVEFEFGLTGKGEARSAKLVAAVSEFTWKGTDAYSVRHGGRILSRYEEKALMRDVRGGRALWDCITSPASELGCRALTDEIFAVYRERFSVPR
ncbi:MAG TPA: hypothetical protein DCZ56_04000 [Sutterella sp.]|nr:hypothetical protein [Sutterella sp.]